MELSIVIPIYNEEKNIHLLYERLNKVCAAITDSYELVFVNDGSRDLSEVLIKELAAKDPRVKFIIFSRNFGHQIAVTAGLDHTKGDAVVIIDADLQDPPELINDLYEKLKAGYQVVYAKRRSRQGEGLMKKITAKYFYRILKSITSVEIPVDTGDFRIIDRKIVEYLKKMPEQHKFLRGQISWIGFNQTYIEYDRAERHGGKTGYTYKKMIRFALDGITSFSDLPLKFATFAGFFISGISFLLIIYALFAKAYDPQYQRGWASTIISILFIGGVQLIGIGIIGEYMSRLSQNIRNRPLYILKDTNID
ncbi:MAG: glycosyltransferase family 2 protein [Chitinophagales bacterium]|nr:glycosyltransferase family 2 protein [Chitinophagales bacterium]